MIVTLTNFFAVRICESRLGAPGFTELRPGSLGRHQVSFSPVPPALSAHPDIHWKINMTRKVEKCGLQINP